jgi:hypothetical protein
MNFNSEVLTSLTIALGLIGLSQKRSTWLSGLLLILGTVNTPAVSVAVALALVYLSWAQKREKLLVILPLCAGGILLESYLRRGSPWIMGYENNHGVPTDLPYSGLPGFSYPLFLGLISILFSFGKGLLFFLPSVFLPPAFQSSHSGADFEDQNKTLYRAWIIFLIGLVLVYSKWWSWYGGLSWGPRFFLFGAFPASYILSRNLYRSQGKWIFVTGLALTLSLWVGLNGLIFGWDYLDVCSRFNYQLEAFCWYVPEYSVLIRPFIVSKSFGVKEWVAVSYYIVVYLYFAVPLVIRGISKWIPERKTVSN